MLLWAAIAGLVALHFVHLRADFPNFSPWMDYSKYTDEGWYANAAIRHALTGHWRLPGDFNPAVALPVWPLLARLAFAVGGVSLPVLRIAALLVWVADLLLCYGLMRRAGVRPVPAQLGLLFLAASAYGWAFSRLALLEPLMMLWVLAAWFVLLRLPKATQARLPRLAGVGLLCLLALLSKTTALFVLPSVAYLVGFSRRFASRQTLGDLLVVAVSGAVPWAAYFFGWVRPRYLADFHYLFEANRWPQPSSVSGWLWAFWYALHGALWVGPVLCGLAIGLLVLGSLLRPALWREPLVVASLLSGAGYVAFIGWHNNPQPRYYEVVFFPLVMVVCLGAEHLGRRQWRVGALAWGVLVVLTLVNLRQTIGYVRHPQYTWLHASEGIKLYIDQHPESRRMLLSVSSDDITLMTGLPTICDDFGATDLAYRIHQYRPGWYAAWNELDPGSVKDISTLDRLEKVAEFPALDDEDRDVLVLYRLKELPPGQAKYDVEGEEEDNQGLE